MGVLGVKVIRMFSIVEFFERRFFGEDFFGGISSWRGTYGLCFLGGLSFCRVF